jgi:hypothetical protein
METGSCELAGILASVGPPLTTQALGWVALLVSGSPLRVDPGNRVLVAAAQAALVWMAWLLGSASEDLHLFSELFVVVTFGLGTLLILVMCFWDVGRHHKAAPATMFLGGLFLCSFGLSMFSASRGQVVILLPPGSALVAKTGNETTTLTARWRGIVLTEDQYGSFQSLSEPRVLLASPEVVDFPLLEVRAGV